MYGDKVARKEKVESIRANKKKKKRLTIISPQTYVGTRINSLRAYLQCSFLPQKPNLQFFFLPLVANIRFILRSYVGTFFYTACIKAMRPPVFRWRIDTDNDLYR